MSLYKELLEERNKRQTLESELKKLQDPLHKTDITHEIAHQVISSLFNQYIYSLAEDEFYNFVYDLTFESLNVNTQKRMKAHTKELHTAYSNLNERILFNSPIVPSEDHKHFYQDFFMQQIWDDLISCTKDYLHPNKNNPDFKTVAMKDANKKCTEFFLLTMKRMECIKETSALNKLTQHPLAYLAKEHKKWLINEAKMVASNMRQEYASRIALQGATKIPNSSMPDTKGIAHRSPATLFQPTSNNTSYLDYARYITTPINWALEQSGLMKK